MDIASKRTLWFILLGFASGSVALAGWRTPEAVLRAPGTLDPAVAVSGNIAVLASLNGAIAYTRSNGIWDSGVQIAATTVTPPIVAANGAYVAVGSTQSTEFSVFKLSGGTWTLDATIQPEIVGTGMTSTFHLYSLALSGTTLLAGSTDEAIVYVRGKSGWVQEAMLEPPAGTPPNFGVSVALSGDAAAMGPSVTSTSGEVFLFSRTGGAWSSQLCSCGSGITQIFTASDLPSGYTFGTSLALDGDTLIVGSTMGDQIRTGPAYIFTRGPETWSQQARLTPPDASYSNSPAFGGPVGISGNVAFVAGYLSQSGYGAVLVFVRNGGTWVQQTPLIGTQTDFGTAAALSGDALLVESHQAAQASVFRLWNTTVTSNPPGRTFALSGTGCPSGTLTTPYTGLWTDCTLAWDSPDLDTPGARYTFQNWADGGALNPRLFSIPGTALDAPYAYSADFLTEYQLSTQSIPQSGGTVTGGGWYTAGTSAATAAIPNPGFLFTGFSGALTGFTTPQTIAMTGPKTVTGTFAATPPAVLNGIVSAKSGTASDRVWTVAISNAGPGTAYNAQLFVLAFAQTFGTPCTALPVRLAPAALPLSLGILPPQAQAHAQVALDFTGCPANARFLVSLGYMSNGGASGGMIQLANQFQ